MIRANGYRPFSLIVRSRAARVGRARNQANDCLRSYQLGIGIRRACVSPLGGDPLDECGDMTQGPQMRSAAFAILDSRSLRFEHEAVPIRIGGLSLRALILSRHRSRVARPPGSF